MVAAQDVITIRLLFKALLSLVLLSRKRTATQATASAASSFHLAVVEPGEKMAHTKPPLNPFLLRSTESTGPETGFRALGFGPCAFRARIGPETGFRALCTGPEMAPKQGFGPLAGPETAARHQRRPGRHRPAPRGIRRADARASAWSAPSPYAGEAGSILARSVVRSVPPGVLKGRGAQGGEKGSSLVAGCAARALSLRSAPPPLRPVGSANRPLPNSRLTRSSSRQQRVGGASESVLRRRFAGPRRTPRRRRRLDAIGAAQDAANDLAGPARRRTLASAQASRRARLRRPQGPSPPAEGAAAAPLAARKRTRPRGLGGTLSGTYTSTPMSVGPREGRAAAPHRPPPGQGRRRRPRGDVCSDSEAPAIERSLHALPSGRRTTQEALQQRLLPLRVGIREVNVHQVVGRVRRVAHRQETLVRPLRPPPHPTQPSFSSCAKETNNQLDINGPCEAGAKVRARPNLEQADRLLPLPRVAGNVWPMLLNVQLPGRLVRNALVPSRRGEEVGRLPLPVRPAHPPQKQRHRLGAAILLESPRAAPGQLRVA